MMTRVTGRSARKEDHIQARLDCLFQQAKRWCVTWGLSRLMRDVTITFSDEIGSAVGQCDLRAMTITLRDVLLLPENEPILYETLCHELAHIVASLRYSCTIEEHGPEWSGYMERAGFSPRPVIPQAAIVGLG